VVFSFARSIAVMAQVTEAMDMAFREVSVNEIREVLRVWLGAAGRPAPGYRTIAAHCGLDRKTVRRYVEAAQAAGLRRDDDADLIDDGLIGMVAEAVRPVRPDGHGAAWEQLLGFEEKISAWVAGDGEQRPLTITKIETLLARQGCVVPYRTLNRFASERCGFGRKDTTVRVADLDFSRSSVFASVANVKGALLQG